MPTLSWIDCQLRQQALERFTLFAPLSLRQLKAPSDNFCTVADKTVTFLEQYHEAVLAWFDECVDGPYRGEIAHFFVDHALAFIQAKNQFIAIQSHQRPELEAEYLRFLVDFRQVLQWPGGLPHLPQRLGEVLAVHQVRLEQLVKRLATSPNDPQFVYREPVCRQYSPELQLQILHTSATQLVMPLLDLGCGETAGLVQWLRQHGHEAWGVDRSVLGSPFTTSADWLEYPLEAQQWGSIVSHMAFSNHFLHHHLRADGQPEQYARRYMEILRALKPHGTFLYTPGLPFIEELLPREHYHVVKYPIKALHGTPLDHYFRANHQLDVFYACHITRL